MEEHLIHYLTLISKLSDILDYINKNFEENDLSSYIKECKSLCIDKVKTHHLIELFLTELKHEQENTEESQTPQEVKDEYKTEDKEMTDTINNLSMLMQTNTSSDMSPEIFDSLGSGIIKLLRPIENTIEIRPQIKNELNTVNTNINFQIKKKHEH